MAADAFRKIERACDNAGVETVGEGQGGRGEMHGRKLIAVEIAEAVTRGGDRHGDGILVPIGHGALALALRLQRTVEPRIGRHHRLALQAAHRHIGAVSQNALGHGFTPGPR